MSDEQFWDYARAQSRQPPSLAPSREYLEGMLAGKRCLLPLDALNEVCLAPRRCAFLPGLPWWARGLAAWQGEAIVVVDLAAYLSSQAARATLTDGMLLVALHESIPVGFHVSAIGQTIAISPDMPRDATARVPAWIAPPRTSLVLETREDAVILDFPALLADVIAHLETPQP